MVFSGYDPINIYYYTGDSILSDREKFKRIISQLESSGGKNTKHATMKSGLHKGSTAIGQYGLMPLTIRDVAQMRVRKGQADELDQKIASMSVEEAKSLIPSLISENSPEYEKYADTLSEHVLGRYGDMEKAAVAWNQGHYSSPEKIQRLINNPKTAHQANYIPRFRRAAGLVGNQALVDKALTETKGIIQDDPSKTSYEVPELREPAQVVSTDEEGNAVFNLLQNLIDPEEINYKKRRKKQMVAQNDNEEEETLP